MMKDKEAYQKFTVIKNELGLHARSAARIAAVARDAAGRVWIEKDDLKADASSIIDLLTLVCEKGTKIRIIIEDVADTPVLNAIADLVDYGFGE